MNLVVGFITYNDNSSKYLSKFWPSLEKSLENSGADYSIMVWDNSDGDNLANQVFFENKAVNYIKSPSNIGFSAAYNKMISKSVDLGAEYFLMINPDTLVDENAIKYLLETISSDKKIAAVVPKILRWDFKGDKKTKIIDSKGLLIDNKQRFFDAHQGEFDDDKIELYQVFGFSGAAVLLRLSALKDISFFEGEYLDELIFMYKEDADLSFRLFLAGYKTIYDSRAVVYHDRTASPAGEGIGQIIANRRNKSRLVKTWSFRSQLIIAHRYIRLKLPFFYKVRIISYQIKSILYTLVFETYLLKELKLFISNLSEMNVKRSGLLVKVDFAELLKITKK